MQRRDQWQCQQRFLWPDHGGCSIENRPGWRTVHLLMKRESRLRKRLCTVAALLLVFAFPQMARPWATRGPRVIDKTAVDGVPDDGPVFLKKYANYISRSSTIPDTWRDAPGLFSRIEEDPNHGWFKERLAF